MTEFAAETRHYCRNPKCRSKLPKPASNEREAFCARGCHTAFYRKRCLVCEGPIERSRDDQKICGKLNAAALGELERASDATHRIIRCKVALKKARK